MIGSKFRQILGVAATVAFVGWVGTANAQSLLNGFINGTNTLSDDNGEILLDAPGGTLGVLEPGDVLVGAIGMNEVNGINIPATYTDELTALFALEVQTVTPVPAAVCGGDPSCAAFAFAPPGTIGPFAGLNGALTAAAPLITALDGSVPTYPANLPYLDANGAAMTGSEVAIFFLDPAQDFAGVDAASPNIATTMDTADGGQALVVGTAGFPGGVCLTPPCGGVEFWFGTGPAVLPSSLGPGSGIGIGGFTNGINFLSQAFPGLTFLPDPVSGYEITTTGNINDPATGPFVGLGARSDTTFNLFVQRVPEPGAIGLMGIGLLGLGLSAVARRRRKVS